MEQNQLTLKSINDDDHVASDSDSDDRSKDDDSDDWMNIETFPVANRKERSSVNKEEVGDDAIKEYCPPPQYKPSETMIRINDLLKRCEDREKDGFQIVAKRTASVFDDIDFNRYESMHSNVSSSSISNISNPIQILPISAATGAQRQVRDIKKSPLVVLVDSDEDTNTMENQADDDDDDDDIVMSSINSSQQQSNKIKSYPPAKWQQGQTCIDDEEEIVYLPIDEEEDDKEECSIGGNNEDVYDDIEDEDDDDSMPIVFRDSKRNNYENVVDSQLVVQDQYDDSYLIDAEIDFGEKICSVVIARVFNNPRRPIQLLFWDNINFIDTSRGEMTVEEFAAYYRLDSELINNTSEEFWSVNDENMRDRLILIIATFERREMLLSQMKKDISKKRVRDVNGTLPTVAEFVKYHCTKSVNLKWRLLDGDIANADSRRLFFIRRHLFGKIDNLKNPLTKERIEIEVLADYSPPQINQKRPLLGFDDCSWLTDSLEDDTNKWLTTEIKLWHESSNEDEGEISSKTHERTERIRFFSNKYIELWQCCTGSKPIDIINIEEQGVKFGIDGNKYSTVMQSSLQAASPKSNVRLVNSSHKLNVFPFTLEQKTILRTNQAEPWFSNQWVPVISENNLIFYKQACSAPVSTVPAKAKILQMKRDAVAQIVSLFDPARHTTSNKKKEGDEGEEGMMDDVRVVKNANKRVKKSAAAASGSAPSPFDYMSMKSNPKKYFARMASNKSKLKNPVISENEIIESGSDDDDDENNSSSEMTISKPKEVSSNKKKRQLVVDNDNNSGGISYGHTSTAAESAGRICNKKEAVSRVSILMNRRFDSTIQGTLCKFRYDYFYNNTTKRDMADCMLQLLSQIAIRKSSVVKAAKEEKRMLKKEQQEKNKKTYYLGV